MSTATISPQEFEKLHQSGAPIDLVDVRTPMEYQEVHVEFARNVPLDRLDAGALIKERSTPGDPLYVICKSGARGRQACEKIRQAGFENVINVDGGTQACEGTGLPLTRGRKVMSLERQVRIAAGSLVVLGVGLGLLVHPGFLGLSAFVGAGLVFAGVTDTCGMGMMLARMPWNQKCSNV